MLREWIINTYKHGDAKLKTNKTAFPVQQTAPSKMGFAAGQMNQTMTDLCGQGGLDPRQPDSRDQAKLTQVMRCLVL